MSLQRYKLNNPNFKDLNFRLLYISTSIYGGDWHSTVHAHHCTELFYVLRGKGSFIVNETIFDVKEDDLIIVNPNVPHTERSKNINPLEYIVLGIEGLEFTTFNQDEEYGDYSVHNYYDYKHEILFYLKALVQEMSNEDDYYEILCHSLLQILIINMIRRTKANLIVAPSQKVTKECRFIEQYINSHFKEDITLDLLSELTFMNKYYLVHAFKKYKGISPINFLVNRRMEEAKELLDTTNYSISQIATVSGFSSQSYFSQMFKKEMKVTPNQYRKEEKKDKEGSSV